MAMILSFITFVGITSTWSAKTPVVLKVVTTKMDCFIICALLSVYITPGCHNLLQWLLLVQLKTVAIFHK